MLAEERYQELLEQSRAFKEAGNQHYEAKDYRSAMRCYHKCLLHARVVQQIPDMGMGSLYSGHLDRDTEKQERLQAMRTEALQLVSKCYNNLAACLINGPKREAEAYLRAVEYCDKVLANEPTNQKALFRKGVAFYKAGQHEKAIEVFNKCPHNVEGRKMQNECKAELEADRKRRRDEIRRNFEKARQREDRGGNQDDDQNQQDPLVPNGEVAH